MTETIFVFSKHLHVWCVTLSFGLFVLRGLWALKKSDMLNKKLVRVSPHLIDSLLLVTGVLMIIHSAYSSSLPGWMMVKFALIAIYIGLGIITMKREAHRKWTFPLAIGCFITAAYLAINKPSMV